MKDVVSGMNQQKGYSSLFFFSLAVPVGSDHIVHTDLDTFPDTTLYIECGLRTGVYWFIHPSGYRAI